MCKIRRVIPLRFDVATSLLQKQPLRATHPTKIYLGELIFMLQATPQILEDLDSYMPTSKDSCKIARFFSLLADQTRVRLLCALAISPLCVTDISRVLQLNQTTVSHQLRLLRDVGIVETQRQGKLIQYKISNPKINEILLVGVEYLGY